MTKTLTLIRGLPGSGKTTLAKELMRERGILNHYEADQFFTDMDGNYDYQPHLIQAAHTWCKSRTISAMTRGEDVIVSNTFTRKWEMQDYIDAAEGMGYVVEVLVCTGEYENVHNVPQATIEMMRDRWEP